MPVVLPTPQSRTHVFSQILASKPVTRASFGRAVRRTSLRSTPLRATEDTVRRASQVDAPTRRAGKPARFDKCSADRSSAHHLDSSTIAKACGESNMVNSDGNYLKRMKMGCFPDMIRPSLIFV
jgi:hypothetical protein